MPKLILVQGISGSGKTYWSKQWVEEDPEHRVRFNYDDIRCMLGKYWVPAREHLVKDIFFSGLETAMNCQYDIVIDNMSNLNPKHIKEYEDLVEAFAVMPGIKYEIEFKLFDTPVEECIRRDSLREIPIGEKVIKEQWKRYRTYIISQSIKNIPKLEQDPNLSHCIIVDMDATLCFNVTERPFFGEGAADMMIQDEPNIPVCNLVKQYCGCSNSAFIIITGRDESCRQATLDWLEKYHMPPTMLFMRPAGNYCSGAEMKKRIFESEIKDKYFVDFVIDDSTKVVKMWRELGLTCLQPNEGKF